MSESSPEIPPPPLYASSWAFRLGFALLAAFTLILGFAFFDRAHRKELETVSETTAVGDTRFFQAPTDTSRLPAVGATLNGQPLYVASLDPVEVRDTHTHLVATDVASGLGIYELSGMATKAERERVGAGPHAYLLKVAGDRWVIARPNGGA